MVKINCKTKDTIKLTDCVPFQGNLKKRTEQDVDELRASLSNEGLLMPFAVWKHDDKCYLLDGHGRRQALMAMTDEDPQLLSVDWPCVYIEAETEDDARKALLQITSQYGKITKQGVKQFMVSIPDYKAPAVAKFVAKPAVKPVQKKPANGKTILKLRIANDKVNEVKEILGQFKFIELL